MKILKTIIKHIIAYLHEKNIDVIDILPEDFVKNKKLVFYFNNTIYDMATDISIKRSEIIDNQRKLIIIMEPIIIHYLSRAENNWERGLITKYWFDCIKEINTKIDEHEDLMIKFTETHQKINNIKIV